MPKGLIADRQGYMVNGCLSYNVGEKYKPIRQCFFLIDQSCWQWVGMDEWHQLVQYLFQYILCSMSQNELLADFHPNMLLLQSLTCFLHQSVSVRFHFITNIFYNCHGGTKLHHQGGITFMHCFIRFSYLSPFVICSLHLHSHMHHLHSHMHS